MAETCPECGSQLVERGGLLVCTSCGLVAGPVYESGFERGNEPIGFVRLAFFRDAAREALEALAVKLGIPVGAALELYKRLRKHAGAGEAAAIALFATAKRSGAYISLARACELLSRCGVRVSRRRAFRILLTCAPLVRASSEEALEVYAHKLDLPESLKRKALAILREVRPYAGGRDPYLVALAAIYLASGAFTIYGLAKAAGRSPGRLHDNIRFLQAILARKVVRPPGFEPGSSGAEGLRAPLGRTAP